jgi:uncharacterized SAM-binding protein YcdF (DUF218 family)
MKKKILIGILLFLILLGIGGYLFSEQLCESAGRFMAPQCESSADAAILEGDEYISTGIVKKGTDLLTDGRVKKIIIVIHRIAPADHAFGIDSDYPDAVRQKLINLGLKEERFKIIVTPMQNPITLKEAQFALKELAGDEIHSVILVSQSFHTRRSYLTYQYIANSMNIKIYPYANFANFDRQLWWTEEAGLREFCAESVKLFYYVVWGHLPLRFSY